MEKNVSLNEVEETTTEINESVKSMDNDELKTAIQDTLTRIRTQSITIGFRTACMSIMQIIAPWHQKNCSHREYERIFKKLEEFCNKALKQQEQSEEPTEETVQN